MKIGIIGNGEDKFTTQGADRARGTIMAIIDMAVESCPDKYGPIFVSGHSPLGGVDIWTEQLVQQSGNAMEVKAPLEHSWNGQYGRGYKWRNLEIANSSDILHVIVADKYPEEYEKHRFKICYHCVKAGRSTDHVKSGACWTATQALKLGKTVEYHIVNN